ncbi:hemin uptake protein HemP [Elioraea sp.]|uniref:hemin uptake protein HemP n=1 Tax=Elioraea sp. TaxID=2185103 RepID=UPI0025B7CC38|nr:hemin uptake protein HemP [Elioraea sp.]
MTGLETSTAATHTLQAQPESAPAGRVSTTALMGARAELEIEHKGEIYRLRITRAGKLILTK